MLFSSQPKTNPVPSVIFLLTEGSDVGPYAVNREKQASEAEKTFIV